MILLGAVAPLVRANRAEVPPVTLSRTCFTKSSSIPTSAKEPLIAPIPAPIAAPRREIKKNTPNRKPQKATPARARGEVQLTGLGCLVALLPADHGRVLQRDHLPLLH